MNLTDLDQTKANAERINDLLSMWHWWSAAGTFAAGYPSQTAACRQARASRQYDDANGSLDAYVDACLCEAVDAVLDQVDQPFRTALHIQARNLATGAQVWTSPRLPADREARALLLVQARTFFADRLALAGLM